MNWAPVLGLCQEAGSFTRPVYKSSFNPASWAWGVGLRVSNSALGLLYGHGILTIQ